MENMGFVAIQLDDFAYIDFDWSNADWTSDVFAFLNSSSHLHNKLEE